MTDTSICSTLLGSGITLFATVITPLSNILIEWLKNQAKIKQQERQTKRVCLNKVYESLIDAIVLYPSKSPSDILEHVNDSPGYFMKNFDDVIRSLNYKLDDYKKNLNSSIDKSKTKTEISNIEYSILELCAIRDKYLDAQEKYKIFSTNQKCKFELYASQEVRNRLVEFEVVIHNVFISGNLAGDEDDPINNIIEIARRNLINSIRNDMGIN